jgi:NAD(P)H-hydrate repair Nnr-like enzyme with NAD(P)H-hydrate epimerase domain
MGIVLCVLLLLLAALYFAVFETLLEDPHYSVAIDSISGLDPVLGSKPALDPAFNLTFHVASHGFLLRKCASHDLQVDVSCRGIPLASSV